MLARILGICSISAALAAPAAAQSADSVHYSVAPVMRDSALAALTVEMRFSGDADGETQLYLPGEWAGSDSLWHQLDSLTVRGATAVRDSGEESRILTHAPGAPLVVRYRVTTAYAGEPGFGWQKARPIVHPDWFFFHGEGVFAVPAGRDQSPAGFAWGAFPAGWRMASDLDHIHDGSRPGVVNDVIESATLGGADLRVTERMVDGAPLRVAVQGSWPFEADAFADAVARIIHAENAFWGDGGRPFVVQLAPLGGMGTGYSFSGTARSDAFSVASTPNFPLAEAQRFLAHEYMHTWIAREVGGPSADEASGFWLSEGFTDFYAGRVLLRAGLWTPADFVAEVNRTLLRNASSPARLATSAEVAAKFWTDANVRQLPYDRGHLLGLLLDDRIRRHTGGRADLDDVLREMRVTARQLAERGTGTDAETLFSAVLMRRFDMDVLGALALHLDGGEPVVLPADLYGTCARVETATQPDFSRGFDAGATTAAGNVVTGVDPAGPAYAAGMRDGMRLLRREAGQPGDGSVELAYRVDDGGTERVIRYLPAGRGTVEFQRVVLTPEATSARCVALMSGA
ncbi:hypothetical protein [Longimicrobium sp.]|uniref:M61 family metallopeptidase n=1 Tax=Longimicrobium sp. TaxID=2029185 RepID=UPI002E379EE2|nr:hypothetical protein [Longimicrobium sp.]HEX6037736.1 hypothetical protein [Longimicrobium sp.]